MNLNDLLQRYRTQYEIVGEIDLDTWHKLPQYEREPWLRETLQRLYQKEYKDNQRILCVLTQGDIYVDNTGPGAIVKNLQTLLDQVDITNFFVVLCTNESIEPIQNWFNQCNTTDKTSITVECFSQPPAPSKKTHSGRSNYQYNSSEPVNISIKNLSEREKFLLLESEVFCMYPWIHLHAYPSGEVHPCCHAEWKHPPIGNSQQQTLETIWNSPAQRQLRLDMLSETSNPACERCYEQEKSGFFSGRKSANKHHGHNIGRVGQTQPDGQVEKFEMTYWDIRFSNLCNLRCRTCGPTFSSQWYQDQVVLAGAEWGKKNKVLNYAGRTKTDMWEQLIPHLDYVEKIYFAGGEPLLMEEHYNILEELERRNRFDVKLLYNTNFTEVKLKDRLVFDYWRKFESVAVGASLDAMGPRAEYIRKGTDWDQIVRNRERMLEVCPDVDFYISPTLSIMNALHLPVFHRDWVDRGFLRPQDLNVNILQDGMHFRVDIAPIKYKQRIRICYEEHLEWLRPLDPLQRATVGFESAIKFMMANDNTALLPKFWKTAQDLDTIRNENILEVIPELEGLL